MKLSGRLAVLVTAFALVLSACGAAGGSRDGTTTIGVSFYTKTIPMYVRMEEGMKDAARRGGVELEFAYADGKAGNQVNQINNFITRGVDLILASPVDVEALVPAYRQAREAGIPILSVGNKVADREEDAYIGPDIEDWAYQSMKRVVEGMGGKGRLLLITGPPQIAFVQMQHQGWKRALAEAPGVTVAQTLVAPDLSKSTAVNLATTGLAANSGITGIIGSNDEIALGAVQAVKERGIRLDDVYIAGWDGSSHAIEAIKAGDYDLTLSAKANTWGANAVDTAVGWLRGERPAQHRVPSEYLFVDKSNVGSVTAADLN